MIPVATFAQAHGWQPYQVRQLCQDLGIPTKASERSREDWQRLEVALEKGPDWLAQKKLPLSSKFQAKTFTTWDVTLPNGTRGKMVIPGLDCSLVEFEDGIREWLATPGLEVQP